MQRCSIANMKTHAHKEVWSAGGSTLYYAAPFKKCCMQVAKVVPQSVLLQLEFSSADLPQS